MHTAWMARGQLPRALSWATQLWSPHTVGLVFRLPPVAWYWVPDTLRGPETVPDPKDWAMALWAPSLLPRAVGPVLQKKLTRTKGILQDPHWAKPQAPMGDRHTE